MKYVQYDKLHESPFDRQSTYLYVIYSSREKMKLNFRSGGVLLMGYELYRQLANRRHRRKRQKASDQFEPEEDDQSKSILEGKSFFFQELF